MKFVADECVEKQIVDTLRDDGYEIIYILEIEPEISDERVLEISNEEKAILITTDKDFSELTFRKGLINNGVILLRLAGLSNDDKSKITLSVIKDLSKELENSFTVINKYNVRVRKLENYKP